MEPGNFTRKSFSILCAALMFSMFFQNVAAEIPTYTIDDDGSNIVITVGQKFNVSVHWSTVTRWLLYGYDLYGDDGYNSTVIDVVGGGFWQPNDDWYNPTFNLTFEGIRAGNDTITYNLHKLSDNSIEDSLTFNVTVIESNQSVNLPLMVIIVIIIAVVPSAIIIKSMKGERKDEK